MYVRGVCPSSLSLGYFSLDYYLLITLLLARDTQKRHRDMMGHNAQCPRCESRESETIQHTFKLFECEAFEEEREVFLSRLYSVRPLARQLNDEYRCRLVMGDKLPREISTTRSPSHFPYVGMRSLTVAPRQQ